MNFAKRFFGVALLIAAVMMFCIGLSACVQSGSPSEEQVPTAKTVEIASVKGYPDAEIDNTVRTLTIVVAEGIDTFDPDSIVFKNDALISVFVYADQRLTRPITGDVALKEGKNVFYLSAFHADAASQKITFTVTVNRAEHVHVMGEWEHKHDPTCTAGGLRQRQCVCGYTESEVIPALGHDLDDGVVTEEPTCTEEGLKTYTCQREGCGYTETEKILPQDCKEE